MNVFPGHRLSELLGHMKCRTLRHLQCLPQLRIDRLAIDTGSKKGGQITSRGEHLTGPSEIVITLLVSRWTNRHARIRVALHDRFQQLRSHYSAIVWPTLGEERLVHAEGFQDTVFDKLTGGSTVATFERELQ